MLKYQPFYGTCQFAIACIFSVVLCYLYPVSLHAATDSQMKQLESIGATYGYGTMCLKHRLGENFHDTEAKIFGQWVGKKYMSDPIDMHFLTIATSAGVNLCIQEEGSRCDEMLRTLHKLYVQAGLLGDIWIQALHREPVVHGEEFEIDSNIDDLGFTLGYVSSCANNPSEASSAIYQWFIDEWGTQKLEAFDAAFEKGVHTYKKGNGRDCTRLLKRVQHILNKIDEVQF